MPEPWESPLAAGAPMIRNRNLIAVREPPGALLTEHRAVALDGQLRGPVPAERLTRPAGSAQAPGLHGSVEQPLDRGRRSPEDPRDRRAAPRRRPPRGANCDSSTPPARRGPSPRARADRSPRPATGRRTRPPARRGPRGRRPAARPGMTRGEAELARALAQLRLVRRRVAGQHEHRAPLRRDEGDCVEQPEEVLVRALGRDARAAPAGRRSRTGLAARLPGRLTAGRRVDAERHDVDLARRRPSARRGRAASPRHRR